ncbi:MAG: type IV toxin-antitoxin system AbiEi family antitoxin [Candidatus Tantalella remota]|nr:type IV toxin-antitoxin system AbiEi family antitoxin [Candidatus Tantalella remota]
MKNGAINFYLGPRETGVIARLDYEKVSLFTKEQFDRWFGFDAALRTQVIFRLKKKGILTTIKRGVYFYSPLKSGPAGSNINEFLVPPVFFPKGNYYIGYSTMYNYYGFTDQIFQVMYILNTSLQKKKTIGSTRFKMLKISSKRMYGLEKIQLRDTEVIVSGRERTLIDLIYFPEPVGGLKKAFAILKEEVLKNTPKTVEKLIRYAIKFPNVATLKRIGFVLGEAGLTDKELAPLLKIAKKTSLITLYPSKSRKGKINKKWMVIENAT